MASKTSEYEPEVAAALQTYVTRLGDNALILGQRLTELVTHGPELEEELANANIALDCIGQARLFYGYAAKLAGDGRTEDDFAYRREASEFQNVQLVELPNGHFGMTTVRQVLFDAFYVRVLESLTKATDQELAAIAARAVREVRYHLRHSVQWLIRLGDGTDLSHRRTQAALQELWSYTGELFAGDTVDHVVFTRLGGPNLNTLREQWNHDIADVVGQATLVVPDDGWMASGGRQGVHTEHLGYLIAEMQHLSRSHPGATW